MSQSVKISMKKLTEVNPVSRRWSAPILDKSAADDTFLEQTRDQGAKFFSYSLAFSRCSLLQVTINTNFQKPKGQQ
jgi:hypothetical protein